MQGLKKGMIQKVEMIMLKGKYPVVSVGTEQGILTLSTINGFRLYTGKHLLTQSF